MTAAKDKKTPHYEGHRIRLKDRFLKNGGETLADYELLELLLFQAIPRRDVKPLAKELINTFGSFADVITTPTQRLLEIKGLGKSAIISLKLAHASSIRLTQEQITDKPVLSSWQSLLDYCRTTMAYNKTEQFRIIFLDKKNTVITDEVQGQGTVDHTPVYTREVVKRALELSASALILVHNHPSGDPKPSRGDIIMTKDICDACKKLGIEVHDHIIVGKNGHSSFKTLGHL